MYPSWSPLATDPIWEALDEANRTGQNVVLDWFGDRFAIRPGHDPVIAHFMFTVIESGEIWRWWQSRTPEQLAAAMAKPSDTFAFKPGGEDFWEFELRYNSTDPTPVIMENRQDPIHMTALRFAARWAHLIEVAMASGASLEDVAMETSLEAVPEGIKRGTFDWAIMMLGEAWVHGEQLKQWSRHNVGKRPANTQPDEETER